MPLLVVQKAGLAKETLQDDGGLGTFEKAKVVHLMKLGLGEVGLCGHEETMVLEQGTLRHLALVMMAAMPRWASSDPIHPQL